MTVQIPILEYHDLGREYEGKQTFHSPYVIDPLKFHAHLQWLRNNNFETVSCDDLLAGRVTDKSVILTFDDGHISSFSEALPILRKFDFQATFFLVAQFIGRENYLSAEHIQEMHQAGMHFESHSLTHPYLLTLESDALAWEIRQSKHEIEQITGRAVHHFCIPYGFYNRELLQCVRDAGYKSAVTEKIGYAAPSSKPFTVLPRFTVKKQITLDDFTYIMRRQRSRMVSRYLVENTLHGAKKILGFKGYMRLKSLLVTPRKQGAAGNE